MYLLDLISLSQTSFQCFLLFFCGRFFLSYIFFFFNIRRPVSKSFDIPNWLEILSSIITLITTTLCILKKHPEIL
ncbi:hypothetical protein V1514DRAFT_324867 [Lipomyces japonicus]|uniref:uncharacterized protein n=1 Tax=Lipomyces japonicus TaxID=56871 RepID=UPI0034CD5B06